MSEVYPTRGAVAPLERLPGGGSCDSLQHQRRVRGSRGRPLVHARTQSDSPKVRANEAFPLGTPEVWLGPRWT